MMRVLLLLLIMTLPQLALANTGRILYVAGQVTVERDGRLYRAVKNARVQQGDIIKTSTSGRLHMRMSDRTLLSLKPDTTFSIETYRHTTSGSTPSGAAQARAAAPDRSVFGLFKGGFRAITGLIGQRDKSAFSVNTPVATIGIRGTSFVANLVGPESTASGSAQDVLNPERFVQLAQTGALQPGSLAPPVQPGSRLTVGVGDGAVILSNSGGTLVLENGEFGQVTSASLAPQRLLRPLPDDELENGVSGDNDATLSDNDDSQTQLGLREMPNNGEPAPGTQSPDTEAEETVPPGSEPVTRRNLAYASSLITNGGQSVALTIADEATVVDGNGSVTAFVTGIDQNGSVATAALSLDSGAVSNRGADPQLGLSWGRWSGDLATLTEAGGNTTQLDVQQLNLHLIHTASTGNTPVVPMSGNREFVLVGNTDPTSDSGGVGFLGHASLSADFDNQSVSSSLSLSVDNQNWQAQGQGSLGSALGYGTPDHHFGGSYSAVQVDGVRGGQGQFSGFFTDQANAAGLSYALENGTDSVHGAAAFEAVSP